MKYKNIKKKTPIQAEPSERSNKRRKLKLLALLIGWLIFLSSVYMTANTFEFAPVMFVYMGLSVILFLAFYIMNGGLRRIDLSTIEKPPEVGYDDFQNFINYLKRRQEKAQYIFIAFVPFPVILMVDYMILYWTI